MPSHGEIIALRVIVERSLVQSAFTAEALRSEQATAVENLSNMEIDQSQSERTTAIRDHAAAVLDEVYTVARAHKGSPKE